MVRKLVCALVVGAVALAGCSTGHEPAPTDAASQADGLWQSRTAHLGESSKVVTLIADAGFGSMGAQTLTLHTDSAPYALTVAYTALDKPFSNVDFTRPATLVLGTIANLDRVEVTSGTDSFELTSAQASAKLGFDVKQLGRSKNKLLAYSQALGD
ncbi:MAG: DUF4825 domain-containing protein [Terracoccus sp.]